MQYRACLPRTGDFWLDTGLLGVWKYFVAGSAKSIEKTNDGFKVEIPAQQDLYDEGEEIGITVNLDPTSLLLGYDDHEFLNLELRKSMEYLKTNYLKPTKDGKIWWQGLGYSFFSNQTNLETFFEPPSIKPEHRKAKWKKGVCDFCGSAERLVKSVGATEHPLVVVPKKFSSFYSNLEGDTKICSWCGWVSKFSPLRLFYNIAGNSITAIVFESNDLLDLIQVFNNFSKFFIRSNRYRNFPNVMKFTRYALENFLDFLFATVQEIEKKQDSEGMNLLRSGIINRVHILKGNYGRALSIERYHVIPNVPKVFDFISTCNWLAKDKKSYNSLIETASCLIEKRGTEIETVLREEFARRIFYNKDVSDLLEEFLIKNIGEDTINRFTTINIDKFITLYVLNQNVMDSDQLNIAKDLGNILGDVVFSEGNESLLYTLRSTGNLPTLLSFLHQLLVRYIDDIKPDRRTFELLLTSLDNSNWHVYKSLIGIYSVLKYKELESKELVKSKQQVLVR
jgi:hypothetical protein